MDEKLLITVKIKGVARQGHNHPHENLSAGSITHHLACRKSDYDSRARYAADSVTRAAAARSSHQITVPLARRMPEAG